MQSLDLDGAASATGKYLHNLVGRVLYNLVGGRAKSRCYSCVHMLASKFLKI